ncbi:leucine-rich repeat domain-containing protein [Levilactobacillus yiduensis]|uniref:leucine-rich repeat domain-containing protein n=1 Tax=Levilactobacillus yiduensis TaxID=2953880 RepID=UPI000EF2E088|nr:leucine-rich repeat domain-containing protein [Levilactobacillus yiduensis]AYM03206.1 leucine-rich repeat domain-containing protein [Levilactobacillus brevis]
MRKGQRVNQTPEKILVAGVTVAALGTGLLPAHPAQAAAGTPASSMATVASAASQASVSRKATFASSVTRGEVSVAAPASSAAGETSSVAAVASSVASEADATASSIATNQAAQSQAPSSADSVSSAAAQQPATSSASMAAAASAVIAKNWYRAGGLRMNRLVAPSVRMSKRAVAEVAAAGPTTNYTDDNGFEYTLNDGGTGYVISGYTGTQSDIVIPDTFNPNSANASGAKWVVGIADSVFANKGITSLTIGKNLSTIGSYAFENDQLKTIKFPSEGSSLWKIGASAFAGNQLTETLTLPASVTAIGDSAFIGNGLGDGTGNQLTGIKFAEDAGTASRNLDIYASAFANNALTSVTLPADTNTIGTSAFANNQVATLSLDQKLTSIGDAAFKNNALTSVAIPNLVKTIGDFAFTGNPIQTLTLGDQNSQLERIGKSAFANNKGLTGTLSIPDSVNFVNEAAFANDALTGLNLGKSTGTIGKSAFANNRLTDLTISNGISNINDSAFAGNQLTHLDLGTGVETIGNSAFVGSTNGNQLAGELTIPDSVTYIGDSAFLSNRLTGITSKGTVDTVDNLAFSNNKLSVDKIHVSVTAGQLGDDAYSGQEAPLTVAIGISGRTLTGVRAAIEKVIAAVPEDKLTLGQPLVFTWNQRLTYDDKTDRLTLPAGFDSAQDRLTVVLASSGTTGKATDHSGNYSTNSLTLIWTLPNNGSGSESVGPTSTPTNTNPVNPQQPTRPIQPSKPTRPHDKPQQSQQTSTDKKSSRKFPGSAKTGQLQQTDHREATSRQRQIVRQSAWRLTQRFSLRDPVTGQAVNWQYRSSKQPLILTKDRGTATGRVAANRLPQTSEHQSVWQVLGLGLLLSLSWFGQWVRRHGGHFRW